MPIHHALNERDEAAASKAGVNRQLRQRPPKEAGEESVDDVSQMGRALSEGDGATRRRLASWLQRTAGNRSLANLVAQRHPEGATLAVEENAVAQAEALPGTAQDAASKAPAKLTPKSALTVSAAQKYLEAAYGKIKKIQTGNIVELADQAATFAEYDKVNKGRHNPYSNKDWDDGDAKKYIPGLQGFQDGDKIYVNLQTTLHTTTVHEMLHLNTASGFRGAVGETINEGTTERLAMKALDAAGVPATPGVEAYPKQRAIVDKLATFVGEDQLIDAYFGGAQKLINAYAWEAGGRHAFEALRAVRKWPDLKAYADALDEANVEKLLKREEESPPEKAAAK